MLPLDAVLQPVLKRLAQALAKGMISAPSASHVMALNDD